MSSLNQGSDDGAREDQLDLGQEEDEVATLTNGHNHDRGDTTVDQDETERSEDQWRLNDAPLSIAASHDKNESETGSPSGSTHLLPAVAGSVEDTSSLPDDTPSLHVRWMMACI